MTAPTEQTESPTALLPPGTRLVHIGPHKTGTTSLQSAFHASRAELTAQGVHYAGRKRQPAKAVHAVTGRGFHGTDFELPSIETWRDIVREVRQATETRVVVSAEAFSDADPDGVRRVVEDLDPERVHIAVTLRPLARIIPSQWQQNVQSGSLSPFDEWLDTRFNGDGPATTDFWRRHRHDRLVARWAEVVGPERMTVVVVDERDHDQVLRAFEQLVGLRTGTLVAERDRTNRSMTLAETEAVRAFNFALNSAGVPRRVQAKVMHTGGAAYMKRREPGPDEPRIETPQWALDRAGEIAREMVDAIAASGVRVIGDLESLAVVPRSGLAGDHQPEVCVPPEIAASMAMGVLVVSGLARGSGSTDGPAGTPFGRRRWVEPPELARLPTYHLAGALGGRTVDAVTRRLSRVRRRIRRLRSR